MFFVSRLLGNSKPVRVPVHDDESEETLLGHPEVKLGEVSDFTSALRNALKSTVIQILAASVVLNLVLAFVVIYQDNSVQTSSGGFDSSLDSCSSPTLLFPHTSTQEAKGLEKNHVCLHLSLTLSLTSWVAPVGHAISYEIVSFTLGDPDEHAPYIGHNATEVDQLWEDLYGCKYRGVSHLYGKRCLFMADLGCNNSFTVSHNKERAEWLRGSVFLVPWPG
jgi:hypothetical protein